MGIRRVDWRIVAVALGIECLFEYAMATAPPPLPEVPLGPHGAELAALGWRGLLLIVPGWFEVPSLVINGVIGPPALREVLRFLIGWISVAFVVLLLVRLFRRLPSVLGQR